MSESAGGMTVQLGDPPTAQPLGLGFTSDIEFVSEAVACTGTDLDGDGTVDLVDYGSLAACLAGPGGGLDSGCACADFDSSGGVDLKDFSALQIDFTGG